LRFQIVANSVSCSRISFFQKLIDQRNSRKKVLIAMISESEQLTDLLIAMEESTEEQIHEMMQQAHQDAEEIKRAAEEKAERIKRSHLESAEESVEPERNKLIYAAKSEKKMNLIRAKDELIQRAFVEAKKSLDGFRDHEIYKEHFKNMIEEAMRELEGEPVRLHIDGRDENLCKQILNELNVNSEIVVDLTSVGGLNVSTKDEKIVVFNTIESRLDKAREFLERQIFATLYGD
jgi:vacuolar-type H+-ATPase subunit E/Vma4